MNKKVHSNFGNPQVKRNSRSVDLVGKNYMKLERTSPNHFT